ncbi:LPS export ABC transporter periplasmic protein LptC [Thermoproteota archaeon]
MRIKELQKYLAFFAFIIAYFGIIIFSLTKPDLPFMTKSKETPDFKFTNITLTQMEKGMLNWELESEYAEIHKEKGITYLKNMKGQFYQNDKQIMEVSAPRATLFIENSDMILRQASANLLVDNKVLHLRAFDLYWHAFSQELIGSKSIYIQSGPIKMWGKQLWANVPVESVIISQDCKVQISR